MPRCLMAEQSAAAELFDLYGPAWIWKPPAGLAVTSSSRLMRMSESWALMVFAVERPDASLLAEPKTIRMPPGADATDKAEAGCSGVCPAGGAGLALAAFTGFAGFAAALSGAFCAAAFAGAGWAASGWEGCAFG